MTNRKRPPSRPLDGKGKSPSVIPTKKPKDEADREATKVLMDLYSDEEGFHCPKCGVTITNGDKAVLHLAEEINKALAHLKR